MPALLTSTSIRPSSASSAWSQIELIDAESARSPAIRPLPPLVEWPATLWPEEDNASRVAAPMPRLAPVRRMFMRPLCHCERSEAIHGLPCRYAPRNDGRLCREVRDEFLSLA